MEYPKYRLISFGKVVDRCLSRFFSEFNELFTKDEDGLFVFSSSVSQAKIDEILEKYVEDELSAQIRPFSEGRPEFFFVVGSCIPGENAVLSEMGNGYEQGMLRKLVEIVPDIRYFLKEQDISIDMRMLNSAFAGIFSKYFSGTKSAGRNAVFVIHGNLGCRLVARALKTRYRTMENVEGFEPNGKCSCIFEVNEKIDGLFGRNPEFLKSERFSAMRDEIIGFVKEKMENI